MQRLSPEQVGMSGTRLSRIVPAMRRYVDQGKLAGVVTLVARRGKTVHFEATGHRDVELGDVMTQDTIFRLFSQTKPVTGVAVMLLYEEGHFVLTDLVSDYLPEFANMQVHVEENGQAKQVPAGDITIQHLLTHTAGLTYSFVPGPVGERYQEAGLDAPGQDSPYADLDEWSQALAAIPLIAQPGTDWNYSMAMDVLGRLVEVVSGQSFRTFLKARIFDPLGMPDTDFYVPEDKLSRFAAMYGPMPDGSMVKLEAAAESSYRTLPKIEKGGGGLVSTAADYLRFAQMLANGGELDGVRLLGPRTVDLMMSNHLNPEIRLDPLTSLMQFFPARITEAGSLVGSRSGDAVRSWGIGFGLTGFVATEPALTGIPMSKGTFSWGGAASTHFWVDREEALVGIVLTQLQPDGTYPIRQLMQQMTYQAILR